MAEETPFSQLLCRIRAGDQDAATELVRRYEPVIRRVARIRLADPGLRRLVDSADICQAVLASFCLRVALGQYELHDADQLLHLLGKMARLKVAEQVRHQQAQRRDHRRVETGAAADRAVATDPSPSEQVSVLELFQKLHSRLSAEERRLVELRSQRLGWAEIAAELGGTPESLRKRHARAVARVVRELGLEELTDE
jgi:RNA polymerase sigma factor (sigma-70 family)